MKIDEIMTKKLETIEADAPVYDAIEMMIDKRIRSLLVKPSDEKDVSGVITVRDIVYKALGKNLDLNKIKVGEITSKTLVCIDTGIDVEYSISLIIRCYVFCIDKKGKRGSRCLKIFLAAKQN
jgi:CBS domain-containing protein